MKHIALVVSILALFLVIGTNHVYAQESGTDESAAMQDPPMMHEHGMTGDDSQCHMMMEGGEMMHEHHMGGGMPCGMMHEGMMGGDGMMGHMNMMIEDPMKGRYMAKRAMMMLGLDEKQKAAGHELLDKTVRELIKMRANLLIAKLDLEEIIHKDPVDINAAESALKRIESVKTDMFITHLKAFTEFRAMLSPEQKAKLKEIMEMPHEGMMMGGGKCGMMENCKCGMKEGKKKAHHEKKEMNK